MITQAPRGTADWYGDAMAKREKIEEICKRIAASYNIRQIATPVFEHTVLFQRGVGETTDVVQKEMYTFEDRGGRSITLKPEGTAGAVRAYLEHSMFAESGLTKLFYITPAFRYEKPQSGRLRQHHQFGVEYIGSESPLVEVELISLVSRIVKELGLSDIEVHINSIGCANCRKEYNKALLAYLEEHKDKLCKTCLERMERNPLRVIDCKEEGCKEIVANAPKTIDYLDEECRTHFEELQSLLESLGIPYQIDTGIVRGLDYYTKTVFEFVNKDGFTLCGGGRYDNLVHEIDGKQDIPAAGFGMGLERILYFLELEGVDLGGVNPPDLYLGFMGGVKARAFQIVDALRKQGISVETDYLDRSIKAQMKYANKINAPYVVILGEDEIASGKVKVKNMADGSEVETSVDNIAAVIQK
ncbi:MAG: histidine--tRNA ligase [Lachnospiraceae bacterium]|nr:histidine--tRNA ligase [Lachnospiraceae bacterium]MBR3361863.1 histidine--tRNA ligase [Lachnospiraceae bacterium]